MTFGSREGEEPRLLCPGRCGRYAGHFVFLLSVTHDTRSQERYALRPESKSRLSCCSGVFNAGLGGSNTKSFHHPPPNEATRTNKLEAPGGSSAGGRVLPHKQVRHNDRAPCSRTSATRFRPHVPRRPHLSRTPDPFHVCTRTHMYVHLHMHAHVHVHVLTYTCMHTHAHTYMHVCTHAHARTCSGLLAGYGHDSEAAEPSQAPVCAEVVSKAFRVKRSRRLDRSGARGSALQAEGRAKALGPTRA